MAGRMEVGKKDVIKRLKWPFTEKENEEYLFKFERYVYFGVASPSEVPFLLYWLIVQSYLEKCSGPSGAH